MCLTANVLLSVLLAPNNLRFSALSFTNVMLKWAEPAHCGDSIDGYTIQLRSTNHSRNVTTSSTISVNVTGLRKEVQYNVSVYGSINGLNGEKAKLVMTLDGMLHINFKIIIIHFVSVSIIIQFQKKLLILQSPLL